MFWLIVIIAAGALGAIFGSVASDINVKNIIDNRHCAQYGSAGPLEEGVTKKWGGKLK